MTMKKFFLTSFFGQPFLLASFFLLPFAVFAQPANDDCAAPTPITNLKGCSATGAFTNVNATPSGFDPTLCPTTSQKDVWFSFVAEATDVTITVRGKTSQSAGGTLVTPEVSLWLGSCTGTMNQLGCEKGTAGAGIVELYEGGLFIGATYFICVQGASNGQGTFQLCVNNYFPPVNPQSDCPKAAILCDKKPFVVQSIEGAGSDISELDNASCFAGGAPGNNESNSTWFVWTCEQAGTLTFSMLPNNAPDDLDFVIYRLPNGIANCAGKVQVRCMASSCFGATGLDATNTDTEEPPNCGLPTQNNFLKALDMQAGETYALVVNNFSATGNGFSIEFGGSGTFLGPKADFSIQPEEVCLGAPVTATDQSTFSIGGIKEWKWSFGQNSTPTTATGKGPHSFTFNEPGTYTVALTVLTELGCQVTTTRKVTINPAVEIDTIIGVPDCNGGTNGEVKVENITGGTPAFQFSWNGGPFSTNSSLTGLGEGLVNLKIRDQKGCLAEFDIAVLEKKLTIEPQITPPLCTGDANATVDLQVTNGTAPFSYNWGAAPGTGADPRTGMPAGNYVVSATDADLCKGAFEVVIEDPAPVELAIDTINISCFGENDGKLDAQATGGTGAFTFSWTNGATTQLIEGLAEGQFSVTATDANGCSKVGAAFVTEPEDLNVRISDQRDLKCFGLPTGAFFVEGLGGTPWYEFSIDGQNFSRADSLTGLLGGPHTIWVRDSTGCVDTISGFLNQPAQLLVDAEPDTTIELGYTLNTLTATLPPSVLVDYFWSPPLGLSCTDCPEPVITATNSTVYVLKITDADGCEALDSIQIIVTKNRPIYLPNAINPDANGPNDRFTIFGGPGASEIETLQIYDRWGGLVWRKDGFPLNDPALGWDGRWRGKWVDNGAYAFFAKVKFIDEESLIYEGSITVLR